jgi:hypothetical protein
MKSWSAGTLTIFCNDARTDIELKLLDQPDETCFMFVDTPKFASPKRISGEAQGCDCQYRCWLTFLGKSFLKLRLRGDMLRENYCGPGEDRPMTVKYVGVLDVEDENDGSERKVQGTWTTIPRKSSEVRTSGVLAIQSLSARANIILSLTVITSNHCDAFLMPLCSCSQQYP